MASQRFLACPRAFVVLGAVGRLSPLVYALEYVFRRAARPDEKRPPDVYSSDCHLRLLRGRCT